MHFDDIRSPFGFLRSITGYSGQLSELQEYEDWWETKGKPISNTVDRSGTPWLKMYDVFGQRVDEIMFPPEYWTMLKKGYRAGAVWRAFEADSLIPSYLVGYITAFYDTGLYCPYIVSLSTAVPVSKYAQEGVKAEFLPRMLKKDDSVWQGATWMTEVGGGSDLGTWVETTARQEGDLWLLNGEKYFSSNAGADLAVVAARPESAPEGVRGLALFLLPRLKRNGQLNYTIRRIKDKIATRSVPTGEVELHDSEAYLLGTQEHGIYLILEVLNLSRIANTIGSLALTQRALAEALAFAEKRMAFGKPIIEHPLLRKQFEDRHRDLVAGFHLGWEALKLLDSIWQETPRYSERYHLFRLVAHLSKYWTAELAVQTAKWSMEVHGGMGILAEYGVERLLREAMILPIWEGTPHRQILDGVEVMQKKQAHRLLFDHLSSHASPQELEDMSARVEDFLSLPAYEREANSEEIFSALARFTAYTLSNIRSTV